MGIISLRTAGTELQERAVSIILDNAQDTIAEGSARGRQRNRCRASWETDDDGECEQGGKRPVPQPADDGAAADDAG